MSKLKNIENSVKELIDKNEVQRDILNRLLVHEETTDKKEIEKIKSVIRFLDGFHNDLYKLSNILHS